MSNPLAIAAVTATLQGLLRTVGRVTAQPPDRAFQDTVAGERVNLFLYQTTFNSAWRNMDMPGQVKPGERGNPPLALNLSYLLTVYAPAATNSDIAAHRLLGQALSILHDHPVLRSQDIQNAIQLDNTLQNSDLAQQVEKLHINPITPLTFEELSKMWATFQSPYRLSATFQASVVLIESKRPTNAALPALRRGKEDRGVFSDTGMGPLLTRVEYHALASEIEMPAAEVGKSVILIGQGLPSSQATVLIRDPKVDLTQGINPTDLVASLVPVAIPNSDNLLLTLPATPIDWRAGQMTLEVSVAGGERPLVSNPIPLLIAPKFKFRADGTLVFSINNENGQRILRTSLEFRLGTNRRVYLILNPTTAGGIQQIPQQPDPQSVAEFEPAFDISGVPPGEYRIRLRVDGIDSLLMKLAADRKPEFDEKLKLRIPS